MSRFMREAKLRALRANGEAGPNILISERGGRKRDRKKILGSALYVPTPRSFEKGTLEDPLLGALAEGTLTNMQMEQPDLTGAMATPSTWNVQVQQPSAPPVATAPPTPAPGAPVPGAGTPGAPAPAPGAPGAPGAPPAGALSSPTKPWWWMRMRGQTQGFNPYAEGKQGQQWGKEGILQPEILGAGGAKATGLPIGKITQGMIPGASNPSTTPPVPGTTPPAAPPTNGPLQMGNGPRPRPIPQDMPLPGRRGPGRYGRTPRRPKKVMGAFAGGTLEELSSFFEPQNLVDSTYQFRYGENMEPHVRFAESGVPIPAGVAEKDPAAADRAASVYRGTQRWGAFPSMAFHHLRQALGGDEPKDRKRLTDEAILASSRAIADEYRKALLRK